MLIAAALLGLCAGTKAQWGEPSWSDDFNLGGLDESKWDLELTQSGGGNGEMEMYVNSLQTAEVRLEKANEDGIRNGILYIRPQLTEKIMEELHGSGEDWNVPRQEHWLSDPRQPISADVDYYYAESVGNRFVGRRLVLPFKHVRYQTNTTNVCFDNISSEATQPDCENMWASRYNAMDMGTQIWPSGVFQNARCAAFPGAGSGCFHHSGDWFTIDCDERDPARCPPEKTHYTMLQPTASAKLKTRMKLDARFGRLEVRAKLPRGDWLWPAIWMLPSFNNVYGPGWPLNGEIDIMESRGNVPAQCDKAGGYNAFGSTLHWGPDFADNQYARTTAQGRFPAEKHAEELTDRFHVYGVSWTPDGIYTYLDDDSNRVLEVNRSMIGDDGWWGFAQSQTEHCVEKELQPEGGGPRCTRSETTPAADFGEKRNIWEDGTSMAPFDMPFYLMMNVAVGSATGADAGGFFPAEGCRGADGSPKPWHKPDPNDPGLDYPSDAFMKGAHAWLPTWVESEHIAWAVHCALGSALEVCLPSNASLPISDPAQPGASELLRTWYQQNADTCTRATTRAECEALGQGCEYRERPCPTVAPHASLQVDWVKYWGPDAQRAKQDL